MFSNLADWVTEVIDQLGYLGVGLLVALENLFPPIPSEIVLPFAGFVARDGQANLFGMIVAATVGSLVGAWILYGISAWIGPERIEHFLFRYGKWVRLTHADVIKTETWFDKHSTQAVLICRCVPLIRSLISIPAGLRRMPFARFTVYTAIGSLVWNAALIGAGYGLRSQWDQVEPVMSVLQYAVIAAIVLAIAWFLWRRFVSSDAAPAADD
jgi:membrane protein DedA with SNARE-associated domain